VPFLYQSTDIVTKISEWRITKEEYDKKFKEFKDKQYQLQVKLKRYDNGNKNYYLVAEQVLSMAQRALEIFESYEIEEKRGMLQFVFQNLELKEKNLLYKLKEPFKTVQIAGATPFGATWGQSLSVIITKIMDILADRPYMTMIKEKLNNIKKLQKIYALNH